MSDSTERFSDRVDNYIKYRPGYPDSLIETLIQKTGINSQSSVADIGSGTGIFTRQLLQQNLKVVAIEPNQPMREAAERLLADYPNFSSLDAPAENTGLKSDSLDLITAAQALHWFNNPAAKSEFARLLKPQGQLAFVWNQRKIGQPLQRAYEAVLREFSSDYGKVNHMNLDDDDIGGFFAPAEMQVLEFDNVQRLDFESLLGRLKSASYCPPENSVAYQSLVQALEPIFDAHCEQAAINFEYDTRLYLGPVAR